MKKLPLKLGIIFLGLDLAFWILLLVGSANSLDRLDALTFLPVFWYMPFSLVMTSVPIPFLAGASFTTELLFLALFGSLQHFLFGYIIGLFTGFLRGKD